MIVTIADPHGAVRLDVVQDLYKEDDPGIEFVEGRITCGAFCAKRSNVQTRTHKCIRARPACVSTGRSCVERAYTRMDANRHPASGTGSRSDLST